MTRREVLTIEKPDTCGTYSKVLALAEERQHPHFWFHDGDTLLSTEGIYFRIHGARVVPLSKTLSSLFEQVPDSQALYFLPEVKGGLLAWSCLLGLIYSKEQATANPSFRELLSMTRIAAIYDFPRIQSWALACMRRNYFIDPEHIQAETQENTEEKLVQAIEVFRAWWFPQDNLNNTTLAIYALARLKPDVLWLYSLAQSIQPQMWQIIVATRKAMEARYIEIASCVSDIAVQDRESDAHCKKTCQSWLVQWMHHARERDSDVLKVLRQLSTEDPPDTICQECINYAHAFLSEAYRETSHSLPVYTGLHKQKVESWDISPVLMDTDLLLARL